jgi:hypothetical protein
MRKKTLFVVSVYRVGERIHPIIPELHKFSDIDLLKVNEMSSEMNWYGTIDPRINFEKSYHQYFDNIFDRGYDGFKNKNIDIDLSQYDIVIYDDDRPRYGMGKLYDVVSNFGIPMLGSIHGGGRGYGPEDYNKGVGKAFDYLLVFGNTDIDVHEKGSKLIKMGIPSNDILKTHQKSEEYILCPTNLLANHWEKLDICPLQVDENYLIKLGLIELQREFGKKVVFKIKTRHNNPNPQDDINFMKSIVPDDLDYEIFMDVEDDNLLMSNAFLVLSPASTLAFKSIQLGIPTVLINKAGILGHFRDYKGLVDLDTQQIFDEIERQYTSGKEVDFIQNVIEGGIDFTSTKKCIEGIERVLNENN